ncbi:MAG: serine hydrolase domain-containing protein [Bacilli bacterium]
MPEFHRLPRGLPEGQAISSRAIAGFVQAVEAKKLELHSFMLLRHGQVAAEGWWHPYRADLPHMLYSLSKSFTSTAIGMAVGEGLLSVNDPVVSFFPDDLPDDLDSRMASMRVRHLLTMTTGHDDDAMIRMSAAHPQHLAQGFLHSTVAFEPGTHFSYNNGATYMLSALLQQASGQTLFDYLQPRLFQPLGIVGATWTKCARGVNMGAYGLSVKTEDIAKFGQLYLQRGVWQGRRLLSEAWIEEAISPFLPVKSGSNSDWEQGYGYQFWRCRHRAYRADGAFGQFCLVMPEQDAVLAITSGVSDLQAVLDCVWEHLLPALQHAAAGFAVVEDAAAGDSAAPGLAVAEDAAATGSPAADEDAAAQEALRRQQLEGLSLLPPRTQTGSGRADRTLPLRSPSMRYEMEENTEEIEFIQFQFQADGQCLFTQWDERGEHRVTVGFEEWTENEAQIDPYISRIVASGTWPDERTFLMTWRFVETPHVMTMRCLFEENSVLVESSMNVSFGSTELPAMKGALIEAPV